MGKNMIAQISGAALKKTLDIEPSRIQKILIRVNNWIGDIVMISPAMRCIRNHFTKAKISILAKTRVVDSLRGNPFYDELIEYENLAKHRGLMGRWRIIQSLRERKFDLAILFQKAFEAALFSYFSAIATRVGYDTDKRGFLLTHRIHETEEVRKKHHVEYFLDIARILGCEIHDKSLYFHVGEEDRMTAHKIINRLNLKPEKRIVVIHPGTSKPERGWHTERFSSLANKIIKEFDAQIVLTGSEQDLLISKQIIAGMKQEAIDLTGQLSIKEMGAFLERCTLFIGNDSGPMHIAGAVGTPIVALFGPGIPEKTAPYVDPAQYEVITKKYRCAPCRQKFFKECQPSTSGKPHCIEDISVEDVLGAVFKLMPLH